MNQGSGARGGGNRGGQRSGRPCRGHRTTEPGSPPPTKSLKKSQKCSPTHRSQTLHRHDHHQVRDNRTRREEPHGAGHVNTRAELRPRTSHKGERGAPQHEQAGGGVSPQTALDTGVLDMGTRVGMGLRATRASEAGHWEGVLQEAGGPPWGLP